MAKRITFAFVLAAMIATIIAPELCARRKVTPVDTPATGTQAVNETKNDTSRINAKRREGSVAIVNDRGLLVYIDTITGEEWVDSMALYQGDGIPKMEYPLFQSLSVGVDIWDPVMRAFGQNTAWPVRGLSFLYTIDTNLLLRLVWVKPTTLRPI